MASEVAIMHQYGWLYFWVVCSMGVPLLSDVWHLYIRTFIKLNKNISMSMHIATLLLDICKVTSELHIKGVRETWDYCICSQYVHYYDVSSLKILGL